MKDSMPRKVRNLELQRLSSQKHYEANRAKMIARAAQGKLEQKEKLRNLIIDYLSNRGCLDCGETDPIVLEFDHRDPSQKLFAIGNSGQAGYSILKVLAEIEKCDIRCANCHRRKTYKDRGFTSRG